MKTRRNQRGGFTLLELLMVVIIIGILAALALPGYIRAVERSRSSEAMTVMGQLRGAVQRYCAGSDGTFPTGFDELDIEDPNNVAGLSARWTFNFPTATNCTLADLQITADRIAGPCQAAPQVSYDAVNAPNYWTYNYAGTPCE